MSRRAVIRELPPLRSVLPPLGRGSRGNRSESLLPRLRAVAERVRQDHAVAFYSMRQVAVVFDVSMKAVARAYKTLQSEGSLLCLRGSRTMLEGRKRRPLRPVRGVVGMVVHLPSFVGSSGWHEFYMTMEEELRRRDYVADFVFYRADDDISPDFVERLLRHNLDILLWYAPPFDDQAFRICVATTMASMRDAGVKTVTAGDIQGTCLQYLLIPEHIEELRVMRSWGRDGVTDVHLWVPPDELILWAESELVGIVSAVKEAGLQWSVERVVADDVSARAASLPASAGLVFQSTEWLSRLFDAQPTAMRRLCANRRILLAETPLHPVPGGRGIVVEARFSNMTVLAKRIAVDIANGSVFSRRSAPRLEETLVRRVALG